MQVGKWLVLSFIIAGLLLGAYVAGRPSPIALISSKLGSPNRASLWTPLKNGFQANLPKRDIDGKKMLPVGPITIIVMPDCESCSRSRIRLEALHPSKLDPIVLAFESKAPDKGWKYRNDERFRVVVDLGHEVFPALAYGRTPAQINLDTRHRVLRHLLRMDLVEDPQ